MISLVCFVCRILDSNNITGVLNLPNISCQHSSIKLISLLHNKITHLIPSNNTASCFSETYLLSTDKLFLAGNPICNDRLYKTELLRKVCRFNESSPIEGNYCQPLLECILFKFCMHYVVYVET